MALKDIYSSAFVTRLGQTIQRQLPNFGVAEFRENCLQPDWANLKLMERSNRVTQSMHAQFPSDFSKAAKIIQTIAPEFTGLVAICLPNYVAKYGLEDWDTSMQLLAVLTQYSTAEFAVRPFLAQQSQVTSAQMLKWAKSSQADVRRLASEGMRPRLPWGMRLKVFIEDPTPVLAVLHELIFDKSEYVQKSVANNLNDLSKDHPELVIQFCQQYYGQQPQGDWIIMRGLRTLFKQGNPQVLQLLNYSLHAAKQIKMQAFTPAQQQVSLGGTTQHQVAIKAKSKSVGRVYLGYRVHYQRQNRQDSYKDFFLKRLNLAANQTFSSDFQIKWKQLSTRRLYAGAHQIDLLVNTQVVASSQVDLQF